MDEHVHGSILSCANLSWARKLIRLQQNNTHNTTRQRKNTQHKHTQKQPTCKNKQTQKLTTTSATQKNGSHIGINVIAWVLVAKPQLMNVVIVFILYDLIVLLLKPWPDAVGCPQPFRASDNIFGKRALQPNH